MAEQNMGKEYSNEFIEYFESKEYDCGMASSFIEYGAPDTTIEVSSGSLTQVMNTPAFMQ